MKVSREEARNETRMNRREHVASRLNLSLGASVMKVIANRYQSMKFFSDYRLVIAWPIPNDINELILSIDIDLLIAFPIIDW